VESRSTQVVTLLITFLCFPTLSNSQTPASQTPAAPERTYAVRLADEGDPNSPIRAAGQLVFHEQLFQNAVGFRWQVDMALTNASSKDIRAYEVQFDATPERGGGFTYIDRKDFFYSRQNMFPPGSQQLWRSDESPRAMVPFSAVQPQPTIAKVTFKVLFVEFSDGTLFGGSEWGRSLPAARAATVARMKELQQAYKDGGDTEMRGALAVALARSDTPTPAKEQLEHLKVTLDEDGSAAMATKISDSLAVAAERGLK
jgi:hypothetical protein